MGTSPFIQESVELGQGLYRISSPLGQRYVNQYLLVDEDGALLVDTGMKSTPEQVIVPYFKQIGLAPEKLSYVLISHADVDHFAGLASLRELCPRAKVLAHTLDVPWIESSEKIKKERYFYYESLGVSHDPETKAWFTENLQSSKIDVHLQGGESIRLGDNRKIDILHTPGHSPGHVSVYDPSNRAVIIIDAILWKGLYDTQGNIISPPPYYSIESYLNSIDRILTLDFELLLTGHYHAMKREEAIQFLHESKRYVDVVRQAIKELLVHSPEPRSLNDILEQTNKRVGEFTAMMVELVGPVYAHLRELESKGYIHRLTKGSIPYWYC